MIRKDWNLCYQILQDVAILDKSVESFLFQLFFQFQSFFLL